MVKNMKAISGEEFALQQTLIVCNPIIKEAKMLLKKNSVYMSESGGEEEMVLSEGVSSGSFLSSVDRLVRCQEI